MQVQLQDRKEEKPSVDENPGVAVVKELDCLFLLFKRLFRFAKQFFVNK